MINVLSFKLWGDYGHFKKYYTTTSPLTFEFPPPPTVIGIISAIIGLDKSCYLEEFNDQNCKIAICISKPVKKVRWSVNLIDTKRHFWKIHNRTQIRTEYLKDPEFTIYFYHSNPEIYDKLKANLKAHHSVYTVSLGLSELLADFSFCGEFQLERRPGAEFQSICSVVPVYRLVDDTAIDFDYDQALFKANYPVVMGPDREVTRREDILFETNTKPVTCKVTEYFETKEGKKIVFF